MADYQFNHAERMAALAKANALLERESSRLGCRPSEVLNAVRRGWVWSDIEALPVAQANRIEGPPRLAITSKLRDAPVLPVRLSPYAARQHERFVNNWNRAA